MYVYDIELILFSQQLANENKSDCYELKYFCMIKTRYG